MNLINYTEEEQKNIVNNWNYYYSKGLRTLADLDKFSKLVDRRLDDLLALMALEQYTDLYTLFEGWPENYSLCNMIYFLDNGNDNEEEYASAVNDFLDFIKQCFIDIKMEEPKEEFVESAIKEFLNTSSQEAEKGL